MVQSFSGEQERVYPTALTLRDAPASYPDGRALLFTMPPEGAIGDSIGRTWRFVRLDLATGRYEEVGKTDSSGLVRVAGLTDRSFFYVLGGERLMALDWKSAATREIFRMSAKGEVLSHAAVFGDGERVAFTRRVNRACEVWAYPHRLF